MLNFLKANKIILSILSFLIIGLGIYANSFQNEFIWDDDDSIVNNIYIQDFHYFPKYFSENLIAGSGQTTNYWRPVLLISFALDYKIFNLNPLGYHLTNTLLHILVAILGFFLIYTLSQKKFLLSYLPALLFLVHPLQTEAITYIAGRADPLSSVFALLTLIFYVNFRNKNNKKYLFFSVGTFLLALLTKEQSILLPALVLLVEVCFFSNKDNWRQNIKIPLYLFGISVLYFLSRITFLNFNDILGGANNVAGYNASLFNRLLTFTWVIIKYLALLFVPKNLHMAYEIEPITSILSPSVFLFIAVFALVIFIIYKTWRENKLISFGYLWFIIILLPRTNIISINRPLYEHWLYLPMLGFWLGTLTLIIYLFKKFQTLKWQKISLNLLIIVVIIFATFLSYLTILRNKDWRNPITFYEKNLKYTPNSYIQKNNLGMNYARVDRHQEAIRQYQESLEILDVYPQVHSNLANSLLAIGELEEAEKECQKALEIDDSFILPYQTLINIYLTQRDAAKLNLLLTQLETKTNPETFFNLAVSTLLSLQDYEGAINLTQRMLEKYPNNVELNNVLLNLKIKQLNNSTQYNNQ